MSTQPHFEADGVAGLSSLFIHDIPLLDVRAPIEFQRGAFPTACNLPLLDDEERRQVGIRYKQAGQEAAIALGEQLVSGSIRQQRIDQWCNFITQNPDAKLYCFRGGLRSKTVQQWLQAEGIAIQRVEGGYKQLRRYLIDSLDRSASSQRFIVVAGKTGCGKTHLLEELPSSFDLEGRANHRGSAFGRRVHEQPSQIDFENHVSIDLLKICQHSPKQIFVEDESRAIGSLSVPHLLHKRMSESPLAVIEQKLEERVQVILNDYILANFDDFKTSYEHTHFQMFAEFLRQSLSRIRRRLGDDSFSEIAQAMDDAINLHEQNGETVHHANWIAPLLTRYYDPMYEYQLDKKSDRIVFRGDRNEFLAWASHLTTHDSAQTPNQIQNQNKQ